MAPHPPSSGPTISLPSTRAELHHPPSPSAHPSSAPSSAPSYRPPLTSPFPVRPPPCPATVVISSVTAATPQRHRRPLFAGRRRHPEAPTPPSSAPPRPPRSAPWGPCALGSAPALLHPRSTSAPPFSPAPRRQLLHAGPPHRRPSHRLQSARPHLCAGRLQVSPQQVKKMDILSLGLPRLSTELSDDDIRETAYEVLLASLFVSGKIHFSEEKREKKPKFLKGLRSKTEGSNSSPQLENYYTHLLDLIRVQMEISESMDALTKRALRLISLKMVQGQLDVPCISLQLLSSVGKFDFPTERLRVQWQRRQANVLEELLLFSVSREYDMSETLRIVLSKLKKYRGLGCECS